MIIDPFRFSQFSRGHLHLCDGGETESETQANSTVDQNDSRVGAADQGVAVGQGGNLDQSFTDQSQTSVLTQDNSDRSFTDNSDRSFTDASEVTVITQDNRSSSFTDASETVLNTFDQRDLSTNLYDNSTNYSLDAEFGRAALQTSENNLSRTADLLEKQLSAVGVTTGKALDSMGDLALGTVTAVSSLSKSTGETIGRGLEVSLDANNRNALISSDLVQGVTSGAFSLVETALERSLDDAAAARDQQTGFLSSFYRDREDNDAKATGDFIKYGSAVAAVGLIAWALRRKSA